MKINNLIYVLLFALVCFITGCEDDDSLFSGDENYITSFRLIEGEHVPFLKACRLKMLKWNLQRARMPLWILILPRFRIGKRIGHLQ